MFSYWLRLVPIQKPVVVVVVVLVADHQNEAAAARARARAARNAVLSAASAVAKVR